jgi:type I restriction enzyme S subunit
MAGDYSDLDQFPEMWELKRIGDFASVKGGKRLPSGTALVPTRTNHPYLRIVDFRDGGIDRSALMFVPDDVFPQIARYTISSRDIYVSIVGTIGLVGVVDKSLDGANLTENAAKICNIADDVDRDYLAAFLSSGWGQYQIGALTVGSTQPKLALFRIGDIRVPLPPLAEQKAIAAVLGALDDKIELNRRMNATLEAMARALFQSWFVDFDPVRAKQEGRKPTGMDDATAALFPDSLREYELGEIPEGWEGKAIESLCDLITSGGTPARMNAAFWEPATVPWFKTGELLDGPLIDAEERISEKGLANSSCKLWPAGTILFALYASPTVGRFGVLTKPGTANHAAAALIAKPAYGVEFLMGLLFEARAELQRVAVGAAQQNINQGVLKKHVIIVPPSALARAYSDTVSPWFEQRIKLADQSRTLAALRDTLMPKLLSGELSVAEAALEQEGRV